MGASRQVDDSQEDEKLHVICAEIRKESVILREDARETRTVAENVRIKGARIRARAAELIAP